MIIVAASVLAALSSPAVPPPPSAATTPPHATEPDRARLHRWRTRQRTTYRGFAGSFLLAGLSLHGAGLYTLYAQDQGRSALGLMVSGTSFNAAGLVMTGLASRANGRLHALEGVAARPWRRSRALGWSLLGAGLGVYVASRIAPIGCFTTACAASVTGGGYLAGFAMALVGVHIVGYSYGYGRQGRSITVQPAATASGRSSRFGLSLSGSF